MRWITSASIRSCPMWAVTTLSTHQMKSTQGRSSNTTSHYVVFAVGNTIHRTISMKKVIKLCTCIMLCSSFVAYGQANTDQMGEGMAADTPISVLVKFGATLKEIRITGASQGGSDNCNGIQYNYTIRGANDDGHTDLCTQKRLTIGYSYLLVRTPHELRWAFDEPAESLFLIVPERSYIEVETDKFVMDGFVCLPYTYELPGKGYPDDGQCGRWDLDRSAPAYRRYELKKALSLRR